MDFTIRSELGHLKTKKLSVENLITAFTYLISSLNIPMTEAEKKEWNKEKQRRKQEFFANRKKSKSGQGVRGGQGKSKNFGRKRG